MAVALFATFLLVVAIAPSGGAAIPENSVVVTSASTVEQRKLPSLVNLDGRSHSSLELLEKFSFAPRHESEDLLSYASGEDTARLVDPTDFDPPSSHAHFYDPTLGVTRPARVLAASGAGDEARVEVDAQTVTLSQLLSTTGSALIFTRSLPEPGVGLGIGLGVIWLARLGATRRRPAKK